MNKREFGALQCSDAYPPFFIPTDAPVVPEAPLGYSLKDTAENTKYASLQARYGRNSTIATAEEIAAAVCFYLCEESGQTTLSTLLVDGGAALGSC